MARDGSNNDGSPRKTGSMTRASSKITKSSSQESEDATTTAPSSSEPSTDGNHNESRQQQQQPQQHQSSNDDRDHDDLVGERAKTGHINSTSDVDEGNSLADTADNNSMNVVDSENSPPPRPRRLSWYDALKEGDIIEVTRTLDESETTNSELLNGFLELDLDDEKDPCTPLTVVCCYGHIEIAQLLLTRGADIECRDGNGLTAALGAARFGNTDCLRLLLDKGAKVDVTCDEDEDTALIAAAYHGHTECVRLLLDKGAEVDATDKEGYTALIAASDKGNLDCLRLLLDEGANINATDKEGCTAWMAASQGGSPDCMRLLLGKGAKVDTADTDGDTALIQASRGDHLSTPSR